MHTKIASVEQILLPGDPQHFCFMERFAPAEVVPVSSSAILDYGRLDSGYDTLLCYCLRYSLIVRAFHALQPLRAAIEPDRAPIRQSYLGLVRIIFSLLSQARK